MLQTPTRLVIIRVHSSKGFGVPGAPIVAELSNPVTFFGFTIPAVIHGETDEHGVCLMRLWPNVLDEEPSRYKFTITNPEEGSGKRKIVYAVIPDHDVFLDEISTDNEGDWTEGGIGSQPASGGGTTGGGTAATVMAGTTTTTAPGTLAEVINRGTASARILDFKIPAGRDGKNGENGLNGTGTITVKETITGAPGTPAKVENVGTGDRAELVFTIPAGQPGNVTGGGTGSGSSLPAGGSDGQVLVKVGATEGAAAWKALEQITDTLFGKYAWEVGVVTPPDVSQTVMDATLFSAYQQAVGNASVGGKRAAGANAIIVAMGTAQRLTMKRNGVAVLTAEYSGAMTQVTVGADIAVTLPALQSVSPILAAEITSGTWEMVIAGGANFARTITLAVTTDVNTTPGDGFNPTVNLILPRSLDIA